MRFTRLRLSGFKSFVDPTELSIEPGLTGIIGPNGCGKSNLVEALRWVMGESSAGRVRGDDMDDVIFSGTAKRPSRNLAEVSLIVEDVRVLPPGLRGDPDQIEVTRRIERGAGSDFRINGRSGRSRDVRTMFADHGSGPASPALVGQGAVARVIAAAPKERRALLEEAAGVSGLRSRRQEAESRLKAADANLLRLDDVLGAMDGQARGLRKQARQAERYREISARIRAAEAALWSRRALEVEERIAAARNAHAGEENRVHAALLEATRRSAERTAAAALPPEARKRAADADAAWREATAALDRLDASERRLLDETRTHQAAIAQANADLEREKRLSDDAGDASARLIAECERLTRAGADEGFEDEAAAEAAEIATDRATEAEADLNRLTARVAEEEARRDAARRRADELEKRAATLAARLVEETARRDRIDREIAVIEAADDALPAVHAAEEALERARDAAETAERARAEAEARLAGTRETAADADAIRTRLRVEEKALADLRVADGDLFPPLVDAVTVEPGWEGALAAALGEALTAPLDEAAPVHWRALSATDDVPATPDGIEALTVRVAGPERAGRALSRVWVAPDETTGAAVADRLPPGGIVVTREGAAWRWDGLTVRAGAPTAAAGRLRRRNRLRELEGEIVAADAACDRARTELENARRETADATDADRRAREETRSTLNALGAAREALARATREADALRARAEAARESALRLADDLADAEREATEARLTATAFPDPREAREALGEARTTLAERRGEATERRANLERLRREARARAERLDAIARELRDWETRAAGARGRVAELTARAEAATAALDALSDAPLRLAGERNEARDRVAEAERARRDASDAAAIVETRLAEADRAARAAEAALADAREARARAEAGVQSALEAERTLAERVVERLSCGLGEIRAVAGLERGAVPPEAAVAERDLDRLTRERDALGPVNLLAEAELADLTTKLDALNAEREELVSAINRLRRSVADLNREARERLIASFSTVDANFQELFTRLFGGGKARLELVDADDPLECGLEIHAGPPGKGYRILSLLSGGEQALTALALLFAVFRSNPAPVCVLDEVDAPLDEANVARFCDLVEAVAAEGGTRFLIITHHRLTMARVHRLFGVTMVERGVSRLVGVDLARAEEMVEPA